MTPPQNKGIICIIYIYMHMFSACILYLIRNKYIHSCVYVVLWKKHINHIEHQEIRFRMDTWSPLVNTRSNWSAVFEKHEMMPRLVRSFCLWHFAPNKEESNWFETTYDNQSWWLDMDSLWKPSFQRRPLSAQREHGAGAVAATCHMEEVSGPGNLRRLPFRAATLP